MESDVPDFDPDSPCILTEMQASSDGAVVQEIAESYLSEIAVQLYKLAKAVATNDMRTIADLGHTIAGSAATFGLKRVCIDARQLEDAAERRDLARISALEQNIRTSFPLGTRALRDYIEGWVSS